MGIIKWWIDEIQKAIIILFYKNPCKKCIVRAGCSVGCDQKIYLTDPITLLKIEATLKLIVFFEILSLLYVFIYRGILGA